AVLVAELAVARHGVRRDPEQHRAAVFDLTLAVAERARFLGAAGGVVLGVEVEHHGLAAQPGEPHLLSLVVAQLEVRRRRALLDPVRHPSLLPQRLLRRSGYGAAVYPTLTMGFVDARAAAERLKGWAVEEGFDRAGVASLEPQERGPAF